MKELSDFYRCQAWRQLRQNLILERQDELGFVMCEHCGKPITNLSACVGHHIEPLTLENVNDWNIALNPENVALVHIPCHNEIHNRFGIKWDRKVYLVYGSALSGKTTFVNNNKTDGDLILDLDSIYQALSGDLRYKKPNQIKPIVFAVRDTILEQIKMRSGSWRNAWVIGTFPYQRDRNNLIERLGAESILIEATKEECLQRLYEDETRQLVRKEWTEYINEWFEDYQTD